VKILVLAPHAYYIDRGTPIDLDLLLRAMSLRGDDVDVAVYSEGEDRSYPNVSLHRIGGRPKGRQIRPGFSLRKLGYDLRLFFLAWRLVRSRPYDVVHAGEEAAFVAMLFRRLHGIPYVYDMDSSIAQQMVEQMPLLRPLAGLFNWFEARALKNAVATAPVCNALADLARSRGARHVVTLHDVSQLERADFRSDGTLRQRLGIDGLILMYVGNLQAYQGIDLLLKAFERALAAGADLDLVIAGGSDDDIEAYQAMARSLGCEDRTHFIGHWPASRLGALLAEADILTAPRMKGINTPMKVFPYLHSGLPVLVTDLPTHTQILDDSVAMLAPPEPDGFAEAIVRLARDAELRQRLGEAGRAFVERNHTFDAHVRRVHQLYDFLEEDLRTDSAEDLRTDSAPRSPRALPPHEEAS